MQSNHPGQDYQRRQLRFIGDVQGVGFRRHCERFAEELDLTGWVRNLPDGSVEVVAEGTPEDLDRLIGKLDGRFQIRELMETIQNPTREFDSFAIRR